MYLKSVKDKDLYKSMMDSIKAANSDYPLLMEYKKRRNILLRLYESLEHKIKKHIRLLKYDNSFKKMKKQLDIYTNTITLEDIKSDYFSDKKIAVYTSVFGGYDKIFDPLITPDNCDFFIISDSSNFSSNVWKRRDYSAFNETIRNLDNIGKNRFFKINPHLIFSEYDYSIYVDGNIKIMTDLTEFIHNLGKTGIAIHTHRERNCVYEEAREVIKLKRDTEENIMKHIKYIFESKMPLNFGLFECNILVREHNNDLCKKIMTSWWDEFKMYSKRDQISFAHTLYKNNIDINELRILGNNVFKNYAFRIYLHL